MKTIIKIISILTITICTVFSILPLKPARADSAFHAQFVFRILDANGNERSFKKAEDLEIIKKELSDIISIALDTQDEDHATSWFDISKNELINETTTDEKSDELHAGEISKKGMSNWHVNSYDIGLIPEADRRDLTLKVLSNETLAKNFDMSKTKVYLAIANDDTSFRYGVELHEKPKQDEPKQDRGIYERFHFRIVDAQGIERSFANKKDADIIKEELPDRLYFDAKYRTVATNCSRYELMVETQTDDLDHTKHNGEISKRGISNWRYTSGSNLDINHSLSGKDWMTLRSNEILEKNFDMSKTNIRLMNPQELFSKDAQSFEIEITLHEKPKPKQDEPNNFNGAYERFHFRIVDAKGHERSFEKAEDLAVIKKELPDTLSFSEGWSSKLRSFPTSELLNETKTDMLLQSGTMHHNEISKKGVSNWYFQSGSDIDSVSSITDLVKRKLQSNETLEKKL